MSPIAIDLGGTNVRVAIVTDDGQLTGRRAMPTRPERGPDAVLDEVAELVRDLLDSHRAPAGSPAVIGIGITGPVDVRTGIVDNPHTLDGWPPTDVGGMLERRLRLPVVIENDANTAAVGEWWAGAGQNAHRLAMITIGTGIGAGFLIDGVIQRRSDSRHGEAGHHVLDPDGPDCYCGARGCWEQLAAGPAILRRARSAGATPGTPLYSLIDGDPSRLTGAIIGQAARQQDPTALTVLLEAARWIGLGLVNTCAFFTPDVILLSGSVSSNFTVMKPTLQQTLRHHRRLIPTNIELRLAEHPDDAGLLGAAYLARFHSAGVEVATGQS